MISYKSFASENDLGRLKDVWNEEVGYIYPITDKVFDHHVINSPYLAKNASFIAFCDNLVLGFIVVKTFDRDDIPSYLSRAFISLFFVRSKYRRQGIGSKLLECAEEEIKKLGKTEIFIGQDLGNFFPGIPCDFDNLTGSFMEKRGYQLLGYTHDLLCKNKTIKKPITNSKIEYRFFKESDEESLLFFMHKNFPGRWEFELKEYLLKERVFDNYFLAIKNKEVVGFVRVNNPTNDNISYNITWYNRFDNLYGIGPLGVDKDYRKQGISKEMLESLLYYLKNMKADILIDWTSLLEYYQKFGFEVWKCYLKGYKKL